MNQSNLSLVKTELGNQVYSGLSDVAAAGAINAPGSGSDIQHSIDVGDLERYLSAEGILMALRDEAATSASGNAQVTAVARELVALVDSVNVRQFNIHHARAQGGLSVLVGASMITPIQHAAITALGVTAQTRGREIGVGSVTADDVMRARTL